MQALTRFYHEEEASGQKPAAVEQEFGFDLGPTRVRGRLDRVDETPDGAVIVDYKSSDVTEQKKADQRARESLQLKIYALAWKADDRPPARAGGALVSWNRAWSAATAPPRRISSTRGRRSRPPPGESAQRRFDPTPAYQVCRYCPYNQICPSTATQE